MDGLDDVDGLDDDQPITIASTVPPAAATTAAPAAADAAATAVAAPSSSRKVSMSLSNMNGLDDDLDSF